MRIGAYTATALELGTFLIDGGAMFGPVPKSIWQKKVEVDERNCVAVQTRALLLEGNGRVVLVDTGIGSKMDPAVLHYSGVRDLKTPEEALRPLGIAPEDVTDIIFTHLHFDHAGGATRFNGEEVVPSFPNAFCHVQAGHLEHARSPFARDYGNFSPADFETLIAAGCMRVLQGETEIAPGIRVITTKGHTFFQQHPVIEGDGRTLFCGGDLFPSSLHLSPRWGMAFDNRPEDVMKEKAALLEQMVQENWILFFYHDPGFAAGNVCLEKNAAVFVPVDL